MCLAHYNLKSTENYRSREKKIRTLGEKKKKKRKNSQIDFDNYRIFKIRSNSQL